MDDPRRFLPLTPQPFHLLLALTEGHLHGYAIIRDVAGRHEPPRLVAFQMNHVTRATMAAERIYAAALTGYPRRLRRRYGDQMRDTFAARCRDAAERGTPAIAALLAHEPTDLASASIAERRTPASPLRIAATIECRVAGNADINRPILALATITLDEQGEGLRAQGSGLTT